MRYRIVQIGLVSFGIFLLLEAFNHELFVSHGYHVLIGILAVLCFVGAYRSAMSARRIA